MASVEIGGPYRSVFKALAGASKTTCYTVPPNKVARITQIRITSATNSAGDADVILYEASSGTEFWIANKLTVPASAGGADLELKPLTLRTGDELRVRGAASQHVIINMLEEPVRST
ncbi:MAG: hypothetical protein J0H94_04400 [Rhizobiales bacterium]|nr:hypothetical protein [Hyphomicrobiales bacterium]